MKKKGTFNQRAPLAKSPTSINGVDEITNGGLPKGRPTLICGSAGCGKTLFAMEFLVRGATIHNEPGVFISFEESASELATNVVTLGFDINDLIRRKKLWLEYINLDQINMDQGIGFELKVIFTRIHQAIERVGAKRVVLDTLESLFSGLADPFVLRIELRRLLNWLKKKGVTTIITAERGEGKLTRQGLEEYVSDCVILLDHRVVDQSSIRRLRIVKYRGSTHGTNEYPFLIDEDGFSVMPVTSLSLNYGATSKRISTGIPRLDTMFSGKGFFKGSTILVSGTAGTGKTSIAAQFVNAACKREERVLFFTFEESPSQLLRNMLSIGINLEQWVKKDLLLIHATRPTLYGLETHLTTTIRLINKFNPNIVILDPVNAFITGQNQSEVKAMLLRLVDFLKLKKITAYFTSLTTADENMETTDTYISSLIDTWLLLRDIEIGGERNRGIYILKSRGMEHSNQIREFKLTNQGIELLDVYVGPEGVLTGSARLSQEARNDAVQLIHRQDVIHKQFSLERKRLALEAQILLLRTEYEAEEAIANKDISIEKALNDRVLADKMSMGKSRQSDKSTKLKSKA